MQPKVIIERGRPKKVRRAKLNTEIDFTINISEYFYFLTFYLLKDSYF